MDIKVEKTRKKVLEKYGFLSKKQNFIMNDLRGVGGVWDPTMSKISKWFFGHFLARNDYRRENNPQKRILDHP